MDEDARMESSFEAALLNMQLPFENDFLLQKIINELMAGAPRLRAPPPARQIIKKSEKVSVEYFTKGETALALNQNNEALKAFTHALVMIPGSSKKIADCYIGRSIALQKLKAYPESLEDIERALKLPISEEQTKKLLDRKTVINSLISSFNFKKLNLKDNSKEEIKLSYGENEEIPGVSSAMNLAYSEKYGRHYVATRDIEIGDVLMVQKPFVFVPHPEIGQNYNPKGPKGKSWICDYCLNLTKAPIPCGNCTLPLYCSEKCRSDALKKFHKIECQLSVSEPPVGSQTSFFLRALLIATEQGEKFHEAVTAMEQIKNCKDKRNIGFKDGKFDGSSINAVLSLLPHMDKQKLSGMVHYVACVSVAIKKNTDFFKGTYKNDVLKLGQLFMYLSYICRMNLYGIRQNSFYDRIAHALYPVFNLLNHACACNTLSYDDKKRNKILRACRKIKKGEQIYVSYKSFEVMYMTSKERKDFFYNIKFFNCECEACENNYTYKPELKGALKVPKFLKNRLRKKPNDTESLWELLKLVVKKYKYPCLEAKRIEMALAEAHMGATNKDFYQKFVALRIL